MTSSCKWPIGSIYRYQKEEVELQIVPAITISEANLDRLIELPQILAKVCKQGILIAGSSAFCMLNWAFSYGNYLFP